MGTMLYATPLPFLAFLKKKIYSEMNIPSIFSIEIEECFFLLGIGLPPIDR